MELYRQQELDRLIGHFFDRAMCYAAEGYQHVRYAEFPGEEQPLENQNRGGWIL
jgi:hypothetical protein